MTPIGGAFHYKWQELQQDNPIDRLQRRRILGDRMMVSEIVMRKGCLVKTHAHENEQFACVLSGRIRFSLGVDASPDRKEVIVEGGAVLHLPSNVPHAAEALEDALILDVFCPVSATTGVDHQS